MSHDCRKYMVETVNIMTTDTGLKYKVFICEDCKKYYIKRFSMFLGVQYDYSQEKWMQTGDNIK